MAAASSQNELATNTPSETFGKPAISSNLHWHFRSQVPSLVISGCQQHNKATAPFCGWILARFTRSYLQNRFVKEVNNEQWQ